MFDLNLTFNLLLTFNRFSENFSKTEYSLLLNLFSINQKIFEIAIKLLSTIVCFFEFVSPKSLDSIESLPENSLFGVDSFL